MRTETKLVALEMGNMIACAEKFVKEPKMYVPAIALGVGAFIGAGKNRQLIDGLQAGFFAAMGIIGYEAFSNHDMIIDEAFERGYFDSKED